MGNHGSSSGATRLSAGAVLAVVAATLAFSAASSAAPSEKSTAAISAAFSDRCTGFSAHSSKDISHVETHHSDGGVVKDEDVDGPSYAIRGGRPIDFVLVKSGTTTESFDCSAGNSPPTALLEVRTPPDCGAFADGTLVCNAAGSLRTVWSRSDVPGTDGGVIRFACPAEGCADTFVAFRGTSSTDPDGDIATWSIAFSDGTSAGGGWTTDPPHEVIHARPPGCVPECDLEATLTVTDSAGRSSSDTQLVDFELPD